ALYGQGNGRSPGPLGQRVGHGDRKLDGRIRGGIGAQCGCGHVGFGRAKADATTSNGERKLDGARAKHAECPGVFSLTWVHPSAQPDKRGPKPSAPPAADNRGKARQTSLAGEPRPRARGDETRPRARRTAPARTTRRTSTPNPA